jgi:hypothetical protein
MRVVLAILLACVASALAACTLRSTEGPFLFLRLSDRKTVQPA